jgi:hypothetical protein
MTSTYNWQAQNMINWKGLTNNSAVPSWTRADEDIGGDNGPAFKARPLKIWRKQLNGKNSQGNSAVGMPMDTPGGSVNLGSAQICDGDNNRIGLIDEINHGIEVRDPHPNDKFFDTDANKTACVACNPENHVIKTASTIVDKKYYTDSRAYLQSRGRTYAQNQGTGVKVDGHTYFDANHKPLHPSDSTKGPQYYNKTSGDQPDCSKPNQLVYKPNNQKFSTQGAVSSGSRLLRLKMDTINQNGASFASAYGSAAKNAGRYSSNSNAIYFLKSKHNKCIPHRRTGGKQKCYNKPIDNLTFTFEVGLEGLNANYNIAGYDRIGSVGGPDPDININLGDTIVFNLHGLSGHPFHIVTVSGAYNSGNEVTTPTFAGQGNIIGTYSWTPTQKATYYYVCVNYQAMNGNIIVS